MEPNQKPDPGLPRLLSVRETAELLHLKTQTLRRWRRFGRGPNFVRVGKKTLYPATCIAAWLANREVVTEQ